MSKNKNYITLLARKTRNTWNTKTLANQQWDLCRHEIRESDLFDSMISMKLYKTSGNDGLTKEFYKTFWVDIKVLLMESIHRAFYTKILSIL